MTSGGELQGNSLGSQKKTQPKLSSWEYLLLYQTPQICRVASITLKFLATFLLISSRMECLIPPRMSQSGADVNRSWCFPGQRVSPRVPC